LDQDASFVEMHVTDLTARRPDVVRRLLERGVPVTTLQTILPDWEPFLATVLTEPTPAP
jgi:hypothetical protein